ADRFSTTRGQSRDCPRVLGCADARTGQAAARPARPLSAPGLAPRRAAARRAPALPPAVVPALRRLRAALDDPAARAAGRRGPARARALPCLADAAPPAEDAALLRAHGLRRQSVRARGPRRSRADAPRLKAWRRRPHFRAASS